MSHLKNALTERPHVVATVTQPGDLALLTPSENVAADILEFRLDDLSDSLPGVWRTIESTQTPSLVTVRSPDEGGAGNLDAARRLELYRTILPTADLVDTEIASLETDDFAGFIDEIHAAEALAVASFHDFNGFPGIEEIQIKMDAAYEMGADIAKVAVVVETMSQLFDLVKLVESHRQQERLISAMGMGPLGKISRLILAKAGSCLNYGYLRTENAPGQWSAERLARLLAEL